MRTFDNTTLVSRKISTVPHRSSCDTSVVVTPFKVGELKLDIPIIASPMPDICDQELADAMSAEGALGIIHRFQTIEAQVFSFRHVSRIAGCAIGVTEDFFDRYAALEAAGCRIFCLDTANGANFQVQRAVEKIRAFEAPRWSDGEQKSFLIAGNVATREGFKFLAGLGVDAVRVGIAGGSVCETRTETGIYIPTLEAVFECEQSRREAGYGVYYPKGSIPRPLIIADGGIREPGDMNKCLVAGADLVMCGRIFAGYRETPGPVQKFDGKFYKRYRGAASYGVQQEYTNEKPDYNEGEETLVPYIDKPIAKVLKRFKAGLQSSMSYGDALTLADYRRNVTVENL